VISNLPYNVATPIVMRLLEAAPTVTSILVMVQREVGERFAAGPGSKTYGAVSVKVSYFASAKVVGIVPPTVFVPAPKVESALVRIERHPAPPVDVPSPDHLFALVRAGFGQRRKMLRGALRVALGERLEEVLATAGVDGRVRAEELSLADWAAIAQAAG
jgi:16S rRNA (adenine1518-N6/adenine1519-N6)-dimethyltransferase